MARKRTEMIDRDELTCMLAVARGERMPDLVIRNVEVLDLINGGSIKTNVALSGAHIAGIGDEYESDNSMDANDLAIVPGFIDGHVHIESSMMHPFEFERVTLPLGTTTAICDPHEITNVMGDRGLYWFLRCSELMLQNMFVQIPSCIPSLPGHETNGASFSVEQMKKYREHSNVLGMAEMMNFPGVVYGDKDVLDKIEAFSDMKMDGHAPLMKGRLLNAYLSTGIRNCHETVTAEEGLEKLRKGMTLAIREGTVAKNLNALAPIVSDLNSDQCFLCTDDRNPYEIAKEGHINCLVYKLINEHRMKPHLAYKIASYSAAKHYGLRRLGLIAPGYRADFVLLSDVTKVDIADVFISGKRVSDLDLATSSLDRLEKSVPPNENTMRRHKLRVQDLALELHDGNVHVMEIIPNEIVTKHVVAHTDGTTFDESDIVKIAVVERYGHQQRPSIGFVKGTGLTSGALASSTAHDSHNIIVVGTNDRDMAFAVNTLIESGGGLVVVENETVKGSLPLPVAGLISFSSSDTIAGRQRELRTAFKKQGVTLEEPFLQMAFLALPVIPALKITDKGLFDVTKFEFIPLQG